MKRIWLLASAALVVALMAVGGATLALFSATAGPADNTFVAGTLVIEANRDQGDGVPGPMYYFDTSGGGGSPPNQYPTGYLAPGDGGLSVESLHRVLQVENVGSLDGKLTMIGADLQSGSKYLADKLNLWITTDPDGLNVIATGTVGSFIDADQSFSPALEAYVGSVVDLHFWVGFPLDADNSYQGLTAVVRFTAYAEQLDNNP